MSGSYGESQSFSGSSPAGIIRNYSRYLPSMAGMTADQIDKFAQAIAGSGVGAATGAGGQLADVVAGKTATLTPTLVTASTGASNAVTQSANAGDAAQRAVNAINLSGLSPGEAASVERSLNQNNTSTGNLGVLNPTNTIANAMNFGGAFNSKVGMLDNAASTLAGTAGASAGASGAASGAANANTNAIQGFNTIMNPTMLATGANTAFANQMGQMATGNRSESTSHQVGGGMSGGCCFIFMEAYQGEMPWFVRKSRDKYYRAFPDIATGYKRMAKVLVPLMRRHSFIRNFVWDKMVEPLTQYGAFTHRIPHCEEYKSKKAYRKFWFTVWNILGK